MFSTHGFLYQGNTYLIGSIVLSSTNLYTNQKFRTRNKANHVDPLRIKDQVGTRFDFLTVYLNLIA